MPPGERRRLVTAELQDAISRARLRKLAIDEDSLRDTMPIPPATDQRPGSIKVTSEREVMSTRLSTRFHFRRISRASQCAAFASRKAS